MTKLEEFMEALDSYHVHLDALVDQWDQSGGINATDIEWLLTVAVAARSMHRSTEALHAAAVAQHLPSYLFSMTPEAADLMKRGSEASHLFFALLERDTSL